MIQLNCGDDLHLSREPILMASCEASVRKPPDHVSSMSQSSPKHQRNAESFPFSMPHSNFVQGPRFFLPTVFSTFVAAFFAPSQILRVVVSRASDNFHSESGTIRCCPDSILCRHN